MFHRNLPQLSWQWQDTVRDDPADLDDPRDGVRPGDGPAAHRHWRSLVALIYTKKFGNHAPSRRGLAGVLGGPGLRPLPAPQGQPAHRGARREHGTFDTIPIEDNLTMLGRSATPTGSCATGAARSARTLSRRSSDTAGMPGA